MPKNLHVQFSCSVLSDSLWTRGLQHSGLPCPSPTPRAYSNSCPLCQSAIQPSHPLASPSPPAFNLSRYQGLFQCVSSLHQVSKVLEFQLQHQYFQWIFRTNSLYNELVGFLAVQQTLKSVLQHHNLNYHTIALISHASKVMLKILQARLSTVCELWTPAVQAGFRKGRGTRDQIANICWIIKKARESKKTSTSSLLTMPKPLTMYITTNSEKLWKRWEYKTTLPASWETCMQVKKQ